MAPPNDDLDPAVRDSVEALIQERAQIKDQMQPLEDRLKDIAGALGALLPYGTRTFANTSVSVQRNQRFDSEKFAANYPVEKYPACYKQTPEKIRVQALLGEQVVEQFTKTFDPKVVIK